MNSEPNVIESACALLIKHEGKRLRRYRDTLGIWTIGVGLNLEQAGAREMVARVGADYDALLAGTADLTPEQCDHLLSQCIISTIEWLTKVFPEFSTYSVTRQVALIDMAFMGEGHFLTFHHLIADVKDGDWISASNEALASKWAEQVGQRAHEVALMLSSDITLIG